MDNTLIIMIMHHCRLAAFLLVAAFGFAAMAQEPKKFLTGSYRQDGRCTKLGDGQRDLTQRCDSYLGVLATQEDRPRFMFRQLTGRTWWFVSSDSPEYSSDGLIATYPVSHVFDSVSKRDLLVTGECSIHDHASFQEIRCKTWVEEDRKEIALYAEFHGNGVWIYKPK